MKIDNKTVSAHTLFDCMLQRTHVMYRGRTGVINGITMEDGSGKSFMVRMSFSWGVDASVHIRTV